MGLSLGIFANKRNTPYLGLHRSFGGGNLPTTSQLEEMAWDVELEPLVVPTRWDLPVAPSTGTWRASAVGGRSHREEHWKASPCFPTTGGPKSVRCSYEPKF